jgi:hypothetical protein
MPIEHVLAVVPVSDLERADAWYEALFGRPADNRPMPSLAEWQVTSAGWVQVTLDTDRAGSGLLNFVVHDLAPLGKGSRPAAWTPAKSSPSAKASSCQRLPTLTAT